MAAVVIINGLSGAMGQEIALACSSRGVRIAPFALAGSSVSTITLPDSSRTSSVVELVGSEAEFTDRVLAWRREEANPAMMLVAIDFTHPSKMNSNADLYNKLSLPFVMGTTGGDLDAVKSSVQDTKNNLAVIAPNMGKQVVAFQAMFEYMQENFPGSFAGYEVSVTESHQSTKADTSGTAKAVCQSLAALVGGGEVKEEEDIVKLRTNEDSVKFGVPEAHLLGHAHHTYRLTSPGDKSVVFEFKHNVNGRTTYAEGVVDAVVFLANQLKSSSATNKNKRQRRVFDMVDVLRAGDMA